MNVRLASQSGFSLVEVICAIVILGVGLAGLTEGVSLALTSTKESELQTQAAMIAAGKIELLRADGFVSEGVTDGEESEDLALYRWRQTVKKTEIDGLYDVEVAIEHSRNGKLIYELRTLLFDPPLISTTPENEKNRDRNDKRRNKLR